MKLNYNGVSCKSTLIHASCLSCIFLTKNCYTLCEHFNFCTFTNSKGDIFDENIL